MKKLSFFLMLAIFLGFFSSFTIPKPLPCLVCASSLEVYNAHPGDVINQCTVSGVAYSGNLFNFVMTTTIGNPGSATQGITDGSGSNVYSMDLRGGSVRTTLASKGQLYVYKRNGPGSFGPLLGTFNYNTFATKDHTFTLSYDGLCYGVYYVWTSIQ